MAPVRRPLRILLRTGNKQDEEPSTSRRTVEEPVRRSRRRTKEQDEMKEQDEPSTSNNWRTRMRKKDPQKYKEIKGRERLYSKVRNASLNVEQKEKQRVLTRERVQQYRQRKKEKEEAEKGKSKPPKSQRSKTQEEMKTTEQRGKWAEEKRKQRVLWPTSKRKEVNLKARMKRRQDKEELQQMRKEKYEKERKEIEEKVMKQAEKEEEERKKKVEEEENALMQQEQQLSHDKSSLASDETTPRSAEARRKSLSRARSTIFTRPKIYAETVHDLLTHATPQKEKALEDSGLWTTEKTDLDSFNQNLAENVVESLRETKIRRDACSRLTRRRLASTLAKANLHKKQVHTLKRFSTTSKYLKGLSKRGPIKDKYRNPFAIQPEVKKQVKEFYETNSMQMPNKKDISKKTFEKTSVLQMPLSSLYDKYKSANPEGPIKLSSFCMLRPRHVKLMGKRNMRACLCEYCTNIDLKLNALNKISQKQIEPIKSTYDLTKITLCEKARDSFDAPECYKRECQKCGVKLLEEYLKPLEEMNGQQVEWGRWEMSKSSEGKSRMELATKQGKVEDLIKEITKELGPHAKHLHNWWWQHQQFVKLSKDPPKNAVIAVYDFAENYSCLNQDEVQSAHWWHNQATIHPIVCNYRCPCHSNQISHSLIYITDDRKQDRHAVHSFHTHCVDHLTANHQLKIDRFYRFSDGCSSQYKSKGPFLDVASCKIPTEHHFFGSRHGKGPSDGESAVVKQHATVAVKTKRAVIPSAYALYEYLKGSLTKGDTECVPFRREIFYIPSSSINRERPQPTKAVKHTRKLHCLRNGGKHPTTCIESFDWKMLSCFCHACLSNDGACQNIKYTDPWTTVKLEVPSASSTGRQMSKKPVQESTGSSQAPTNSSTECRSSTQSVSEPDETEQIQGETMTEHDTRSQPAFQDFVTVRLAVQGKKKSSDQFFVAQVTTVEGNNLRLQYMKQQGRLYTWPAGEPQYFLHPVSDVVGLLPSPEPVLMGSRIFFKFH